MKLFRHIRYYSINIRVADKWKTVWVTNDREEAIKERERRRKGKETCEVTCTHIKIPSYMEQTICYQEDDPFTFQCYETQDEIFYRGRFYKKYRHPQKTLQTIIDLFEEDDDI